MKRFLFFTLISVFCLIAKAEEITSDSYSLYFADATVQQGTTVDVYLKAKYDNVVGSVQFKYELPDGVTMKSFKGVNGTSLTEGATSTDYNVLGGCQNLEDLAVMTLEVSADMAPGDVTLKITDFKFADYVNVATKYVGSSEATLTVQRAIPVEPADDDYAFEIIPFTTEANKTYSSTGDNSIAVVVKLKNKDYVSAANFDLTLPTNGKFGIASYKSGMKTTTKQPTVNTERSYNVVEGESTSALSFTQSKTNNVVTYTLGSTGDGDFVEGGDGTIATIYLTTGDLVDSIYTFKINNISITSTPDGEDYKTHEGGEYYFSVFVGTPTETDPIVYGHYTAEAQAALKDAATNFASVDMSECTLDATEDEVSKDLAGILVYGPTKTSYTRNVTNNWNTICLPYDVTPATGVEFYEVTGLSTEKETIEVSKVDKLTANTPALVYVTTPGDAAIATSADGYQYADPSATLEGNGLIGSYKLEEITTANSYYIKDNKFLSIKNKFYADPFKAYYVAPSSARADVLNIVDEATAIDEVNANEDGTSEVYGVNGVRQNNMQTGVNIIKMADGRVMKVVVK